MNMKKKNRISELVSEIESELESLAIVVEGIRKVSPEQVEDPWLRTIFSESLGLKLHNFYTGIERIFQKIADDLNGGVPSSHDWHRRLLRTMGLEIEGVRPLVLRPETVRSLEEFLAFRHVVRNLYGFELAPDRMNLLAKKAPEVFERVAADFKVFLSFLRDLKTQIP